MTKFASGAQLTFTYSLGGGRFAEVRRASTEVDEGEIAFIAFDGDRVADFFHVTVAKVASLDVDTSTRNAVVVRPLDVAGDRLAGRLSYTATTSSDAVVLDVVGRVIHVRALRSATAEITVRAAGVERTFHVTVTA